MLPLQLSSPTSIHPHTIHEAVLPENTQNATQGTNKIRAKIISCNARYNERKL